jgi:hypothetical protein
MCSLGKLWVASAALTIALSVHAQGLYQVNFQAQCTRLDAAGKTVISTINNRTLLKDCAQTLGMTDTRSLVLVFHRNGDDRGDTIDFVDKTTGDRICRVFSLLAPQPVTNNLNTLERRYAYVFNTSMSHSLGSTVIDEKRTFDKAGNLTRFLANGAIQYYLLPTATNGLAICTGKFRTGKALVIKNKS